MKTKGLITTIVGTVIFCLAIYLFFYFPYEKNDMKNNTIYACEGYKIINKDREIVEVSYYKEDGKSTGTVQFTYSIDTTKKRTYKDYNDLGLSEEGFYLIELINGNQIKLSKDLDYKIRTELNN